jgi:hypothetical protein
LKADRWRSIGAVLPVLFAATAGRSHAVLSGLRNVRNVKARMFVAQRKSVKQETLKNVGGINENLYAGT